MRLARWIYGIAGGAGLVALVPWLFLEGRFGRDLPPPVNHPELFYGFLGVGIAWQVLFLVVARDPARYRPLMPVMVLEKLGFGVPVVALAAAGRVAGPMLGAATMDLVMGALFVLAYLRTPSGAAGLAKTTTQ